jgi:hypothetical protein
VTRRCKDGPVVRVTGANEERDAGAGRAVVIGGSVTAVASGAASFLPGPLLVDAQTAVVDGWWRPPGGQRRGLFVPRLEDVTAVDEQGVTYALRPAEMSTSSDHPDREAWPQALRVRLDPVPARETGWVEFCGRDGTTARLLPSPRRAARVGLPVPVAAGPAERELLRHTRLCSSGPSPAWTPKHWDLSCAGAAQRSSTRRPACGGRASLTRPARYRAR